MVRISRSVARGRTEVASSACDFPLFGFLPACAAAGAASEMANRNPMPMVRGPIMGRLLNFVAFRPESRARIEGRGGNVRAEVDPDPPASAAGGRYRPLDPVM